MEYIYVGKIVNTHGIKGEVRIVTDFKYKERALAVGKKIYIGKDKTVEVVTSYRVHKNFSMITIKGIDNINDVLKYKGKNIFTTREELNLGRNEYIDSDLVGMAVMVNGEQVGVVSNYLKDKYQDKIIVNRGENEYLVPFVCDIIESIDVEKRIISIRDIKGLLD